MIPDPVVEEVRRNGAKIAEECGNDIHRIVERLRREQAEHPERLVAYPRRSQPWRNAAPPQEP